MALKAHNALEFDGDVYWSVDGESRDGPFCQRCYDVDGKLVRLHSLKYNYKWQCKACKTGFGDGPNLPPLRLPA